MVFQDLHRPLENLKPKGAVGWIILISGSLLVLQQFFGGWLAGTFGLVPAQVIHRYWVWQPVTYLFLHGGLFHWLFNMFIFWMFGAELERRWGSKQFLKYFFITGVGAGLCILALTPHSGIPTLGCSGAVFGMIVAFAMLFPNSVMYLYFLIPVKVWHAALLFALIEFFAGFSGGGAGISRYAHLAGMVTGYVYLKFSGGLNIRWHTLVRSWRKPRKPIELHEVTDELVTKVDYILEKVLKEGAESLTPEEKRIMDRYSKRKH